MFSIPCCSKVSFSSDDSDFSYILGYKAIEAEIATQHSEMEDREDDVDGPYTNEPLAGEEWTREYRRCMVEKKKRDRMLKSRLKGLESTGKWYVMRIFADFSDHEFKLDTVSRPRFSNITSTMPLYLLCKTYKVLRQITCNLCDVVRHEQRHQFCNQLIVLDLSVISLLIDV